MPVNTLCNYVPRDICHLIGEFERLKSQIQTLLTLPNTLQSHQTLKILLFSVTIAFVVSYSSQRVANMLHQENNTFMVVFWIAALFFMAQTMPTLLSDPVIMGITVSIVFAFADNKDFHAGPFLVALGIACVAYYFHSHSMSIPALVVQLVVAAGSRVIINLMIVAPSALVIVTSALAILGIVNGGLLIEFLIDLAEEFAHFIT